MCYLIAKKRNVPGCYALRTEHGIALAELKRDLNLRAKGSKIQLVTLSRPSAYGEYAPYKILDTVDEFIEAFNTIANN